MEVNAITGFTVSPASPAKPGGHLSGLTLLVPEHCSSLYKIPFSVCD